MKQFKIFITGSAFLLAIAMTFASSISRVTHPPNHYESAYECADCIIPNGHGNVYNEDYFCATIPTLTKCTCLLPSGQLRLATQDNPTIPCNQLFSHPIP